MLIILILDYLRLNISYMINNNKYEKTIAVQGNTNKYTPQGLTYSNKYNLVFQTSYNSKHTVSMLYATDLETGKLIKELKLKEDEITDNVNHVGGITTNDDYVFITSDYEVNEYYIEDIIYNNEDYIISNRNAKLPIRGDFCTYNNGILWVGDFFLNPFYPVPEDTPLLLGYNVSDAIDYDMPDYVISLPKMVQGMVITPDNKFIFTRSFTNLINSDLVIYDNVLEESPDTYKLNGKDIPYYHFTDKNKLNSIKLPPMAEEFFYKDNSLYILFENSSDTYFYAYPKMKEIVKLDITEIDKQ